MKGFQPSFVPSMREDDQVTQSLNVIHHPQGHMSWDQVVPVLNHCQEWVDRHFIIGGEGEHQPNLADKRDIEFTDKFNDAQKC